MGKLKPVCEELVNIERSQMPLVKHGKTSFANKNSPHIMAEFEPFYTWLSMNIGDAFLLVIAGLMYTIQMEVQQNIIMLMYL